MYRLRFSKRKGGVGETVLTLVAGCILIVFCLVLFFKTPDFFNLTPFQSQAPTQQPSEETPQEERREGVSDGNNGVVNVTTLDEALSILEDNDCQILIVNKLEGYSGDTGIVLGFNYFLKIAIEEETVFRYTVEEYSILIIPYENTFIIWLPEDVKEIDDDYTMFEKLEIQTAYAEYDSVGTYWGITMVVKNSGSKEAKLTRAYLNDVPCPLGNYDVSGAPLDSWGVSLPSEGLTLKTGESLTIHVYVDDPPNQVNELKNLASGTTINMKLHTEGGMDYIKLIRLP